MVLKLQKRFNTISILSIALLPPRDIIAQIKLMRTAITSFLYGILTKLQFALNF